VLLVPLPVPVEGQQVSAVYALLMVGAGAPLLQAVHLVPEELMELSASETLLQTEAMDLLAIISLVPDYQSLALAGKVVLPYGAVADKVASMEPVALL